MQVLLFFIPSMFLFTFSKRHLGSAMAALWLSFTSHAQTTPAWTSARSLGTGVTTTTAFAVDAAGNSYEAGYFFNTAYVGGTLLTSAGGADGYLAKYTPAGTLAWVRQLGSTGTDLIGDLTLDAAGTIYVTGRFTNSISLGNNVFLTGGATVASKFLLVRYTPEGTPEWAQQSSSDVNTYVASTSVQVDAVGHVYVSGHFSATLTVGGTTLTTATRQPEVFLARFTTATGALQSLASVLAYQPVISTLTYYSPKVVLAPGGAFYLLTTFSHPVQLGSTTLTSRGGTDVLVTKYSAAGEIEWTQQFGGEGQDDLGDATVDAAGNVFVSGRFSGPATFGTTTLAGAGTFGNSDGFLAKLDLQGTLQWVQPGGGPGIDQFGGIRVDAAGNAYVVGTFQGPAQFAANTLTSAGSVDIVVAAYTPQGQLAWVQQAGGPGPDSGSFLGLDASGNVYVYGLFANACAFGPFTLTTMGGTYLARLGQRVLATRVTQFPTLRIYPNPATNKVHLPGLTSGSQVQLLDAVGRIARTTVLSSEASVSLEGVTPGVYTLRATDAPGRTYTSRLVVQ